MAIADEISPAIYHEDFPKHLPPFDVVLSAGDIPGHLLEFIASKLRNPPVYVLGNHANEFLRRPYEDKPELPGGCLHLHGRVARVNGLLIAGFDGCAHYRAGVGQMRDWNQRLLMLRMTPRLLYNRWRYGRAVDVLLTHAPPKGPHEGKDYPHRGLKTYNTFAKRFKPQVHLHGHVHLYAANAPRSYQTAEGVRVINGYLYTLVEIERAA